MPLHVVLLSFLLASAQAPEPVEFVSASGVEETRRRIAAVPKDNHWWSVNGEAMAWNNKNLHRLYPTVNVYREGAVRELGYALDAAVGAFEVETPRGRLPFRDFLDSPESTTMGVILLHRGKIVFEHYPRQQHYEKPIFWSVTKALVSSVLAILEDRGQVDVSRPILDYLPELTESPFGPVTVRNLLDMAAGVDCPEAYEPLDSCYMLYSASIGEAHWDEASPDNPYEYLAGLQAGRVADQGTSFMYSGPNTFVLGWLVERLTGMPFQDVLSREVWTRMGAEADASILAPRFGVPLTSGGLLARLRDVARFGLLLTPSYTAVSDRPIFSKRYLGLLTDGGNPGLLKNSAWGDMSSPEVKHNVYQWDQVFTNNDVYKGGWAGQGLLVNPERDWVAVWTGYYADDGTQIDILPMIRSILASRYGGAADEGAP